MVSAENNFKPDDDLFIQTSRIFSDDKETIDYLRDQL